MKKKKILEKTSVRKYGQRLGMDHSWFMADSIDEPVARSIVSYMAIRSAHMRGAQIVKNEIKNRLGLL